MKRVATLRVVSEPSRDDSLGTITLTADGVVQATELGQDIFDAIRRGRGWTDRQIFDALADGGWSNGYVTVVPQPAASRAAGHDVTPGHDELHHYWTKGEGLAKWAGSPHPWTALYHHLLKYVGSERAKRMAAQWHHEVFGIWPGEKKGRNPVGPG